MQWVVGVESDDRLVRFLEFKEEPRDKNGCDTASKSIRESRSGITAVKHVRRGEDGQVTPAAIRDHLAVR